MFYREHGNPTWPWEKDETLMSLIEATREDHQLDLSDLELAADPE